ncbi:type II secretion system protein GspL [Geobacter sp. SVR]|uniref:type II secretion system protein GspL n=1 Tax=Geobacter sp. SVR TaxID=2495594 RepID=UPI00143F0296|nr:type II secretion system protein GspL [Geobacter sp. SVR]BCS56099.1 type II secretion system protein GspL [Geobacter sp. SVR]GCF84862.1 type II secretion system protein GspL [Geobacter sp. SVR]
MDYLIIQVEEQRVTAVRFRVSGRAATMAGAAAFELGHEQDLPAVARRIAEGVSAGVHVVLCLPPTLFALRTVELPLTDLRKVREVLPVHMQGEIALPAEEAVFEALPSVDGRFMAVWARRSDIAREIAIFNEAGIDPQYVTTQPLAWGHLPGITADCAVTDGRALAVIAGGNVAFMRAFSGSDSLQELRATLTALELSEMVLPPRLFVFGEQAEALAAVEELPLAVQRLELPDDLAVQLRTDETFQQVAGAFAVVRAAMQGGLADFRRGDLAWTAGDVRLRKRMIVTAVLASLLAGLLFVSQWLQYRALRTDLDSLNTSISGIYRDVFPNRTKAVDEVAEIKSEIKKMAGGDMSASFLDVLKPIAEAKGAGITGLYEAELDGRTLRVKGDARSAQAANEFKAALAPIMATVELGEVKGRPDGTVSFSLSGTVKEVKQ